jgi:osmoprotectant transport system ATP-binding protein
MISIRHVTKSFGTRTVLDQVSLELEAEKIHVLLGPSGCGKSTLLRCILGLLPLDSGEIFLQKDQVTPQSRQSITSELGYVVQEGGLFPHLTAFENVALVAKLRGWDAPRIETRMQELANLMALPTSLLGRYPKQISGGQRQRVGLMRALFLDPDYLILDEPMGALDPVVRAELQRELRKIFGQLNKTVVMVTHDIYEAVYFGHTITLLQEGKVAQHADYRDVLANPANDFVREFVNSQRPPEEMREFL